MEGAARVEQRQRVERAVVVTEGPRAGDRAAARVNRCNGSGSELYIQDMDDLPTEWSLIVRCQGVGPEAQIALGELIKRYERSVLTLIRRRPGPPDQTPEDLKQDFFARVLRRNDIARLDPAKGHFRAWLQVAVTRFLFNEWDRWKAESNGHLVTDPLVSDISGAESPEHAYLVAFCWDTLAHVVTRLREKAPDKARFDSLKRFLPGPHEDLDKLGPIADSLDMTRTALAAAICHLRERFKALARSAVAETLDLDTLDPLAQNEIDREMALFYRTLCEKPEA